MAATTTQQWSNIKSIVKAKITAKHMKFILILWLWFSNVSRKTLAWIIVGNGSCHQASHPFKMTQW